MNSIVLIICIMLFYLYFLYSIFLDTCFLMRNGKSMDLVGRRAGEELGGGEGGKTKSCTYYMKKSIFK